MTATSHAGLIRYLRDHPTARRAMSMLSGVLLATAVGVLGYPVYTNLYQGRVQSRLDRQFASAATADAFRGRRIATGDSLTRIKIPSIGVDVIVVEGTSASALRAGAGHYPSTPLPCEVGNVAIAGHRTTYGRPFNQLDRVQPGDEITLQTPVGECSYVVNAEPFVISPSDVSVLDPTTDGTLTLTTCHPKGSARQRLVLKAKLRSPVTARKAPR